MHPDPQEEFDSLFTDSQLYKIHFQPSLIEGSGYGLFAKSSIHVNEIIAEYHGVVIPSSLGYGEPFLMEDKMININDKYCFISRSPASRANDIIEWAPSEFCSDAYINLRYKRQIKTIPGKDYNALIQKKQKNKAFLVAIKPISAGEQIYISYGFSYWEFFMKEANKHSD